MTGIRRRLLAIMGLAGALALGGCAYDDGFGYGGVSVGTGYYGGGGYYGDGYYGQTGYYQPGLYSGWYDNYYYPGNGYYVYDRGGRRQRWNDGQRRYWEGRRVERRNQGQWQGQNPGRNPGQWQGQRPDRDGRPGQWQGQRPDRKPGNGNWTNRPRPSQGTDGDRGRGNWRGNDAVGQNPRPAPQPGVSQSRPQRDWGARPSPAQRSERMGRTRGPGARQAQPN